MTPIFPITNGEGRLDGLGRFLVFLFVVLVVALLVLGLAGKASAQTPTPEEALRILLGSQSDLNLTGRGALERTVPQVTVITHRKGDGPFGEFPEYYFAPLGFNQPIVFGVSWFYDTTLRHSRIDRRHADHPRADRDRGVEGVGPRNQDRGRVVVRPIHPR